MNDGGNESDVRRQAKIEAPKMGTAQPLQKNRPRWFGGAWTVWKNFRFSSSTFRASEE